jgi:hypothetical protein
MANVKLKLVLNFSSKEINIAGSIIGYLIKRLKQVFFSPFFVTIFNTLVLFVGFYVPNYINLPYYLNTHGYNDSNWL